MSDKHQSSKGLGRGSVNRREARAPAARKPAGKEAKVVLLIHQGNNSNIKALGPQSRVLPAGSAFLVYDLISSF